MRLSVRVARRVIAGSSRSSSSSKREGFGSFHSQDVEVLVRQGASDYKRPLVYDRVHEQTRIFMRDLEASDGVGQQQHGESTYMTRMSRHFVVRKNKEWCFLNHGAFGGALEPLLHEASVWRHLCETQPLLFFDRELLPLLAYTVRTMAAFLHCPAQELLPLPNVTSGLNAVASALREGGLSKGDEVLCLSLTYGSTKKILKDLCVRTGATLVLCHLPLPIATEEDVIDKVKKACTSKTKLVILDHITSNTALELPIAKLASACRDISPTALIVIDAAHSLFSQDVSIYSQAVQSPLPKEDENSSLSALCDVWITNGHKWLSAPKGCAFMWVSPRAADKLRPVVVSHGFHSAQTTSGASTLETPFLAPGKQLSGFAWDGCRDYAALLTVPSALWMWQESSSDESSIGPKQGAQGSGVQQCRKKMRETVQMATSLLLHEWGYKLNDDAEAALAAPFSMRKNSPMSLVPLPRKLNGLDTTKATNDTHAFALQEALHHENKIEVPIKCLEGRLYARISAHIYNKEQDYQRLCQAILERR